MTNNALFTTSSASPETFDKSPLSEDPSELAVKANIDFVLPRLATGGDLHEDNEIAGMQLVYLIDQDVDYLLDTRLEASDEEFVAQLDPEMNYLYLPVDDDGGSMPHSWYEQGTKWVIDALEESANGKVVVHCHMGINRGPSLTFATMLVMGHDPVEAIDMIRTARSIANVGYAEAALNWFHISRNIADGKRKENEDALEAWRLENPHDTKRIIRTIRRAKK